jgi:hypothetical protein
VEGGHGSTPEASTGPVRIRTPADGSRDGGRVVLFGEALIDLAPRDGLLLPLPGGSPYNVAVGLGRLGVPTSFVGPDRQRRVRRPAAVPPGRGRGRPGQRTHRRRPDDPGGGAPRRPGAGQLRLLPHRHERGRGATRRLAAPRRGRRGPPLARSADPRHRASRDGVHRADPPGGRAADGQPRPQRPAERHRRPAVLRAPDRRARRPLRPRQGQRRGPGAAPPGRTPGSRRPPVGPVGPGSGRGDARRPTGRWA